MSTTKYTIEQVSKHNKNNDIWIIYRNKVVDVTAFLSEHPGGPEVLLEHAGSNVTHRFDDVGHSEEAKETMKKYIVGELDTPYQKEEKPVLKPELLKDRKEDGTNYVLPIIFIIISYIVYVLLLQE